MPLKTQIQTLLYDNPILGLARRVSGPLHPFGIQVDRAAAALPQTAQAALFNILTGRVSLFVFGEVTTAIQNQLNNARLVHNPSTGTDSNLCANLDIANDELGTLYSVTGTPGDAMLGAGQSVRLVVPVICKPGTIDLVTSASNTGAVKWTAYYVPIDDRATVTAA